MAGSHWLSMLLMETYLVRNTVCKGHNAYEGAALGLIGYERQTR